MILRLKFEKRVSCVSIERCCLVVFFSFSFLEFLHASLVLKTKIDIMHASEGKMVLFFK